MISAAASTAIEFHVGEGREEFVAIEVGPTVSTFSRVKAEALGGLRRGSASPAEFAPLIGRHCWAAVEWIGLAAITTNMLLRLEAIGFFAADATCRAESCIRLTRDDHTSLELLRALTGVAGARNEFAAALSVDKAAILESLAGAARIAAEVPLNVEWQDPPGLLLVSPERLLRSPGRIRILAGDGSIHPLRGG
jgi:hypothetical protein